MKNFVALACVFSVLVGCVAEEDEDLDLSEDELALTGIAPLDFVEGTASGYVSPAPPRREDVVDGVLGWMGTSTATPFGTVRSPAFKTSSNHAGRRVGRAMLRFYGVVRGGGTCSLGGALKVRGWTRVEGHGNAFTSTDATADAFVNARGTINGTTVYTKNWHPASDATKSETRTDNFDKTYYLSNGPKFTARDGDNLDVTVELVNDVWAKDDGEASVSIFLYGFYSVGLPVVSVECV